MVAARGWALMQSKTPSAGIRGLGAAHRYARHNRPALILLNHSGTGADIAASS
jgi:hypothetical protein